ncbi:MAG: DUF4931 domain-containing protein [Bacillota bacterium]|nr:DUF4931 domain-containing protein [Bacillota bacterium]
MNTNRHLKFLFNVGRDKPNSIRHKDTLCPFCNKENLAEILDEDGPIILVTNKYPTLEDTYQTVLIETDDCNADMSIYDKDHMRKLLSFGVKHWLHMEKSGKFKSVIFYKNHGPNSGGSIKHSHMQIVGLETIDYKDFLQDEYFEGITIHEADGCILNVSTKPQANFTEFNIIIDNIDKLDIMADNIQKIVHYILINYPAKCDSFNLFFYDWKGKIICKAVPRFVTSPLLLGYFISQTSSNIDKMAADIQQLYFKDSN